MSEQQEPDAATDPTGSAETAAPAPAPAPARAPQRRRARRVVRRGTETETVWGGTTDDAADHGSNDERLRRDVPPHW